MMDHQSGPHMVVLGSTTLDTVRGTLTRDGRIIHLRSKAFALLCEFARNSGRVLSKEELFRAVWPGVIVTDESLAQAIRDIRRTLGDEDQKLLRTIPRRGFVLNIEPASHPDTTQLAQELPRIAVLPFLNETGELDRRPLLDAIAEELTNSLARFQNLAVVSRHSAFDAGRSDLEPPEVAARLRADYLVDGAVRLVGGKLRLSLSLHAVASGTVLWGDSLESTAAEWLTLWDLASQRIVSQLFASIEEAGYRSSLRRAPGDLTAFEHLARGKALFRSPSPDAYERALPHFEAAIRADPLLGIAHAYRAATELALHDYSMASVKVKLRAKVDAIRAVELSPDESGCHTILGYCEAHLGEFEAAEREARQAVALNPCDADALFGLATVLVWKGASAAALSWIDRAKDINPLWPPYYDALHSEALLFLGRYDESIQLLLRLPQLSARQEMRLAAAYALNGDRVLARRHAAQAQAREPEWDFVELARAAYHRPDGEDVGRLILGIEIARGRTISGIERDEAS